MSDSNTDNFVNSLFPKKLINELNITNINFNPVAQTGMTKTMLKISTAESKENADLVIPSKDVLSLLATSSNGDIRACINSLQFYCTDRNSIPKLRKKQPVAKGKKTSSSSTKKDAQKIAGCIGEKDASLFLFRALGKVLYCKREDEYEDSEKSLPSHLTRSKRKKLIEIPEEIYENTQISSDNYALYLHQNYPEFFTNIDEVVTVSSNCSQADHIGNSWENKHLQDYSASICARGMMYANARPSSAGGQSGGWRPLHKPQWFDVFKTSNRNRKFVLDNFNGCHYSKQTLFTDIIPYIEKLRSHSTNGLIREISSFPLQRSQQQHTRKNLQALSNDRSDVFADATDSIEHYLTMASMRKKGDFHEFDDVSMNNVIDDVIEDFDDDF
ncbi:cell cycle checkpoint protein RAD17-like [Clytia hemisphaerica]|uniref:Uncharacterized protein n=1 Tax=Clytia hemisphaerica TaxID=252671 RepID=A0A7M5TV01_9CNID